MKSNRPLVSVIIPNYNHAGFLARRTESVLGQTFSDFEVIVLDDASTDQSLAVLQRFTTDPRVQVVKNRANSGSPFIQWNRGVNLARGQYVWIAESDDIADARFLTTLLDRITEPPGTVLSYCQSWRVNEQSEVLGTMADVWDPDVAPDRWLHDFTNRGAAENAEYLIWRNTIPNASAVLFRREAYIGAGGAPEEMRLCGDWMTWARLLNRGDIAYCAEPLNYFRQHGGSVRAMTAWRDHLAEQWRTQAWILRQSRPRPAMRRRLAHRTLHDLLDVVLPAPRGQKLATLCACLVNAGPILARCPGATARALAARAQGHITRRTDHASIIKHSPADARND